LALGVATMGLVFSIRADDVTAFNLVKEGNKYVGEGVKDKVVEIRSEKSMGGLTPNIWYVAYDDEDATFKVAEVKFEGGKKVAVRRPTRPLELISLNKEVMDPKKLNTDSDKALATATGDSTLTGIKIKATQCWLQLKDGGPTWKVRLWAGKNDNPDKEADIGDIYISAEDGKVTRRDVHLERLR
jgi:hypothetical protein